MYPSTHDSMCLGWARLVHSPAPARSAPRRRRPSHAQVEKLRAELSEERSVPSAASGEGPALEVGTVDGFQGREKEVIGTRTGDRSSRHLSFSRARPSSSDSSQVKSSQGTFSATTA